MKKLLPKFFNIKNWWNGFLANLTIGALGGVVMLILTSLPEDSKFLYGLLGMIAIVLVPLLYDLIIKEIYD